MLYSRRKFLTLSSVAALSTFNQSAFSATQHNASASHTASGLELNRNLILKNLHTGENINVDYCHAGLYQDDALTELNHFFRDHRTDTVTQMDPKLLDSIHKLTKDIEYSGEIHIISGYRSPETNEKLRSQGHKVAKRSYHMSGQAIDLRLPGKELKQVHSAAIQHHVGGVGYYPRSNFLHLDTGRQRRWG
jgi:uncharacterized protein YcbK (DUF882 family)